MLIFNEIEQKKSELNKTKNMNWRKIDDDDNDDDHHYLHELIIEYTKH